MKVTICTSLIILNLSFIAAKDIFNFLFHKKQLNDSEWEEHPDEYGNLNRVNIKELDLEYSNLTSKFLVKFYLYTKLNPNIGQLIKINDTKSLINSNFNRSHPTRFITHGWMNDGNSSVNILIRDAYLNRGNFNVFIVDWSDAAHYKWYYFSARKVESVAEKIAEFIDFLYDKSDLSFSNLTLIGHSLGAHASGLAGKKVKRGHIHTIIGLDPAAPWFNKQPPEKRLAATDADYVETIHTDTNYFGFKEPLGTASFYPNWGEAQPECKIDIVGCSHGSSYQYFAESLKLKNNYFVVKCRNYYFFLKKSCHAIKFDVRMGGEPSNYGRARGIYFVDVNVNGTDSMGSIIV